MSFQKKVAIVTGAGGGIGEAYARALAGAGASVVIAEIDRAKAEQVAASIRAGGGKAVAVETDVSSESSTQAMAAAAVAEFGGIDYLVNNAAIYGTMQRQPLLEVPLEYWNRFMAVNLTGALLCTRAVHASMAARGGGAIVNQSSTAAWMGASFYGTAKLALHALTHSLARDLGPKGIRVNAIAPGPTDTEATRTVVPKEYITAITSALAIKRLGTVDDLTGPLLFLLSDEARWITGHILNVDGGQIMRV
jgi:NAD(P)-dependent dehydrogenase (short-subunit alcohol dehydrogenase family)